MHFWSANELERKELEKKLEKKIGKKKTDEKNAL